MHKTVLWIVACLALLTWPAHGGEGSWTTAGPWGARASVLATDPNDPLRYYLGVDGRSGLFRTTNGGASWQPINRGIEQPFEESLAVSQSQPGRLLLSSGHATYLSDDGGDNWQLVHSPHPIFGARVVVIDPFDSSLFYAGNRDFPGVPQIEKSTDGGAIWASATSGLLDQDTWQLVVDPLKTSRLYATIENRFYRSVDAAGSWTRLALPFQNSFGVPLAASPSVSGQLFALGGSSGVWKSNDAGSSWSQIASIWGDEILINPAQPNEIFVKGSQLWRSPDGGVSWMVIPTPSTGVFFYGFALAATNPPTLLFNGSERMVKSTNDGASWEAADTGINGRSINSFATAATPQGPRIYAAGGGLFRRSSTGWDEVPLLDAQGSSLGEGFAVALDPASADHLAVLCLERFCSSVDGGATWNVLAFSFDEAGVRWVRFHPSQPQVLFVGGGDTLARSLDGGASFQRVEQGLPVNARIQEIAFDAGDPNRLLVWRSSTRIYRSLDGGTSFQQLSLPFGCAHMVASPTLPGTLYAAATSPSAPFWTSTDGGTTWAAVGSGLPPDFGSRLVVSPFHPDELYMQMQSGGFYYSPNAGANWFPLAPTPSNDPAATQPEAYRAAALGVAPGEADTLLIGGFSFSVFEYTEQVFRDGFESGDLSAWSLVIGAAPGSP